MKRSFVLLFSLLLLLGVTASQGLQGAQPSFSCPTPWECIEICWAQNCSGTSGCDGMGGCVCTGCP